MASHTSGALARVSETVKGPGFSTWPFKVIWVDCLAPSLALSEME